MSQPARVIFIIFFPTSHLPAVNVNSMSVYPLRQPVRGIEVMLSKYLLNY